MGLVGRAKWTGYDVPDFAPTKRPRRSEARRDWVDAPSGTDAFIMRRMRRLAVRSHRLVDGPSPRNMSRRIPCAILYISSSPARCSSNGKGLPIRWRSSAIRISVRDDDVSAHRALSVRRDERWLPWLSELQPELFVEISPELAQEQGIQNLDWVQSPPAVTGPGESPVTRRLRPLQIDGRRSIRLAALHWGYEGLVTATS